MRKCVICDEKHEENFHITEFATESAEYADKCYKGLESEQSDFLKSSFKVSVKKEDLVGKTLFIIFQISILFDNFIFF